MYPTSQVVDAEDYANQEYRAFFDTLWSLHPNCVLNLHLRHSCTFTYKLEKHL